MNFYFLPASNHLCVHILNKLKQDLQDYKLPWNDTCDPWAKAIVCNKDKELQVPLESVGAGREHRAFRGLGLNTGWTELWRGAMFTWSTHGTMWLRPAWL